MSLRLIVIVLILATAGALGMIAWQIANPQKLVAAGAAVPVPVSAPVARYLVAARALPPGTLMRDSDTAIRSTSRDLLPSDALSDDDQGRAAVTGALVQRFIEAGVPITSADLLRPRDRGFLAAVLAPGTRAVSIAVDPVTGVSGLIWPGDRVDVILTQEMERGGNATAKRIIGETVLTNIRVIGIDQDIVQGATRATNVAGKLASTITLQASADEAERLAVAARMGHLSLAIRAFGDSLPTATPQAGGPQVVTTVSGDDVSPALSQANGAGRAARVLVIQGDQRNEVTFR
jgi:pilus assembly protein CpaB